MSIVREIQEEIRSAYREPSSRDLTILAGLFLILPGLIGSFLAFYKGSPNGYYWIGAGVVLALCRLIGPLFRLIYRGWISFSVILGYFISRILLTLIFFLIITPTGVIMRIVGKDPMERKIDPDAPSYWADRETPAELTVERYEKQF
jgi:hypothetical protein